MTQRCGVKPLRQIVIAGAVGVSLGFAGSLAFADDARGLGRGQPGFGSGADNSGAPAFVPNRRLGDVQKISPGKLGGNTSDQSDRFTQGEIEPNAPRGGNFDRNREARSREWLTSKGRDHRGAPANGRSPFFPDRYERVLGR